MKYLGLLLTLLVLLTLLNCSDSTTASGSKFEPKTHLFRVSVVFSEDSIYYQNNIFSHTFNNVDWLSTNFPDGTGDTLMIYYYDNQGELEKIQYDNEDIQFLEVKGGYE